MKRTTKELIRRLAPKDLLNVYFKIRTYNRTRKCSAMNESEYESYLSAFYKQHTSFDMDFSDPITLTQKAQWLKLYDMDERKTTQSDKYAVRNYIKEVIGDQYLVPIYTINNSDQFFDANEIDFNQLPNQFVIKCNNGCGCNYIVKDKRKLNEHDIISIKAQCNKWLKSNFAFANGFELVYKNIKPCLLVEKYMAIDDDLPDYKFMCFSGEVKYVWCDKGRFTDHRRTLYNTNFEVQPFNIGIYRPLLKDEKPRNYDEMVGLAQILCSDFSYVRVDLYNIEGQIYFGEMTFSSGSGIELPEPIEYDRILGDLVKIDKSRRTKCTQYRK